MKSKQKKWAAEEYGDTCQKIAEGQIAMLVRTNLLDPRSLDIVKANIRSQYNDTDAQKICAIMDNLFSAPPLF